VVGRVVYRHCEGVSPKQSINTSPNPSKGGELAPSLLERAGGEVIIDISHLTNGLYFLKIGDKILKIIKE
jgi:hypothetical protein